MLNTTFRLAYEAHACVESYRKMAMVLGGVTKYGRDTPIPLSRVLEVCGLDDSLWVLQCTIESNRPLAIEFACACAEHVLTIYPKDKRLWETIEAARRCIMDTSTEAAGAARAAYAARVAAGASSEAARASGSTVWDAERQWQTETFLRLLDGKAP